MQNIYQVMSEFPGGYIADEVKAKLPNIGMNAITPRFRKMIDAGMITCTGEKRKGVSGRSQLVRKVLPPPFIPLAGRESAVSELKSRIAYLEGVLKNHGIAFD